MSITLYEATVPVFTHMLTNLKAILDKGATFADAKKIDSAILANSRLAPDMYPLNRQVHIATDIVKACIARLAGIDIPKYEDTEVAIPELHARIDKTIAFIQAANADQINTGSTREITVPIRNNTIKFTARDYLLTFVLPNLYFHITTAYDILRHNGVELSKLDYLGKSDG
jgi:hypothetical protein